MLSFEKEKLHMPLMYEDGINRGQDKTFVIYQRSDGSRVEYSYNDIAKETDKLVLKLQEAGLKRGDRIAVIAVLRPFWFSLTYACLKQGYIMTCIDPGVPTSQIQELMLETEVRAVFTSLKNIRLPEELNESIPVYSIEEDFPLLSKCSRVNDLLSEASPMKEDTFFILFSSGTSAERRKAVLLKHSTVTMGIEYGMSRNANIYRKTTAYTPRVRDLMMFPPYHIAGLLCATYDIYCNTQIIMLERLTPNGLLSALQDLKPDNICTVPSMLSSLYKKILAGYSNKLMSKITINSLLSVSAFLRKTFGIKAGRLLLKPLNNKAFGGNMKGFMIGASPFDEVAHKFFLDMGIDVSMAYGLTELGAPLATTGQGYYPGTTGRVVRHTDKIDIRIVNKDENGRGEVEVLSPYQMISYLNEKDNEGCFTEDAYFKTGDLGYFDADDCLVICGRIKESIVLKNGEKLLPEEIESKYQNLHSIKEVCAFKIPGEGGCDDFAIALTRKLEMGIPEEPSKTRVYERAKLLPPMYRPKEVYVLKEFPLSSSHKIQRFRLTEMVVNGLSSPITDESMVEIDEDEVSGELRKMLIQVDGAKWKTEKLTQGLLLGLDSLTTINLFVAIEDKWGIDLFQTSEIPETFGQLLDIVNNYEVIDKKDTNDIDLSKYPLPVSKTGDITAKITLGLIKNLWRIKSKGLENLPDDTSYILCANHRTVLDPAYIMSCLNDEVRKNICTIGKMELANNKLLKNFIKTQNYIPVDRTGNSIKTLDRCKQLLLEGKNILIFPEGTNVQNNTKMYPLKDGAAKLSISTKKPIIPIHIDGVAQYNNEIKDVEMISLKSRIKVIVGKPIYPDDKTVEQLNVLIKDTIDKLEY